MQFWRSFFIFLTGFILVFFQSTFMVVWPILIWSTIVVWKNDQPWLILFTIGLINDLFLANLLGQTMATFILVFMLVKFLRTRLGLEKVSRVTRLGSSF